MRTSNRQLLTVPVTLQVITSTDVVPEGTVNLYFTESRVLNQPVGILPQIAYEYGILPTDSIITAFGRIHNNIIVTRTRLDNISTGADAHLAIFNHDDIGRNTAARHTHNNLTTLGNITAAFTSGLKTLYDGYATSKQNSLPTGTPGQYLDGDLTFKDFPINSTDFQLTPSKLLKVTSDLASLEPYVAATTGGCLYTQIEQIPNDLTSNLGYNGNFYSTTCNVSKSLTIAGNGVSDLNLVFNPFIADTIENSLYTFNCWNQSLAKIVDVKSGINSVFNVSSTTGTYINDSLIINRNINSTRSAIKVKSTAGSGFFIECHTSPDGLFPEFTLSRTGNIITKGVTTNNLNRLVSGIAPNNSGSAPGPNGAGAIMCTTDANYLYIHVADATGGAVWRRVPLASF